MLSDYYRECFDQVQIPSFMENREFGSLLLKSKTMIRHKGFAASSELQDFLIPIIPSDVYYSSAYYEHPDTSDMGAKGWLGADLIFDIDADHLYTVCDKIHDDWTCLQCHLVGKGSAPEQCPVCGSEKFETNTWACETCLSTAKDETIKLLDMLQHDFGFSDKEISVFFSGHRGYHVHVEDRIIRTVDSDARKEIVDYVCGLGLDIRMVSGQVGRTGRSYAQGSSNLSWLRRVMDKTRSFINSAGVEDYINIGLKKKDAETLMKSKNSILQNWDNTRIPHLAKGVGQQKWQKILDCNAESAASHVDTVVTTDIHRLIRLGGTLHGKTALKKAKCAISQIDAFDPFKDAVAFKKGNVTVFVSDSPKFRIGEQSFGPFKNQKTELPTAAALLLMCKGRAEVAD